VRYRYGASLTLAGLRGTPAVLVAVGAVVALQALVTYAPTLQTVFETVALSPGDLLLCSLAGGALLLVLEIDKRAARGWRRLG